jgi:hypothetical protein
MNKRLFVLICSIILFQYIYNSDCSDKKSGASEDICNELSPSSPNKQRCVYNNGKCEEKDIKCTDEISNPTENICKNLIASQGNYCTLEDNKCVEKHEEVQTSESINLKFSLAFFIFLFLFLF